MKTWFIDLWSHLRSSYWFIPLMMAVGAILLSISAIRLDSWIIQHDGNKFIEWFFIIRPDGARAMLATIAGSMITVAGVTFSMSVLAVSFSMGQIGPRLIQNFMRDRVNQSTLGVFVATFLYSILVLLAVVGADELGNNTFVPHVAILIAIILTIVCTCFFIFFLHHIPESINIYNILAKISHDYHTQLNLLIPEKVNSDNKINDGQITLSDFCKDARPIISKKNGYIRYLDRDALLKLAIKIDCIIAIKYQPGVFVSQGTPLVYVNKILEEHHQDECLKCFAIGRERDQDHDILFLSDEVVEIIARALSPGINSPFIAITAIDWLQIMIESLSKREIPDACLYDEDHRLRIIADNITLADFVDNVFGSVRSYVSHDRNALMHILDTIKMMLLNSKNEKLNYLLKLHAEKFFAAANENLTSNVDKNEARELIAKIAKL